MIQIPDDAAPAGPLTTAALIDVHSAQTPQNVALLAENSEPLTYLGLQRQVDSGLEILNRMGIGRNDRVALVLPNGPEMATAFLTVAAGATAAPLNPAYQQTEFDFSLSDLNARAVIVSSELDSPVRAAAAGLRIPVIELTPLRNGAAGEFTLWADPNAMVSQRTSATPDDVALVLHTSGTTSRPKIVPLTQTNLCTSACNIRLTLQLGSDDRCLNVMPLFHIHGLMAAVLASISAGASVVCTPGYDSSRFFDWLGEFQPTWYTAVPTIHQSVLERAREHAAAAAANSLRFIRSSSSSLPPAVMQELEQTFDVPVIESYGMTEAAHQMCSNPLPPETRKPGSVGRPAGPDVAVMDEAGQLLPADSPGELVIRGANVTCGYENNPSANKAAFTDGWFRTGDQGCIDREGYVTLTGRIKEIINRGGEKVSPREIDEVLLDHPAIRQAVSFAVPHASLGEDIAAAVVLCPGRKASEQEIRRFAFSRLAGFKVPSRMLFVDEIPKGATGKLQRIGLHERLADLLEPAYAAPETPVEQVLADMWTEVLGAKRVGRNDNFFMLGGDSLSATRVISRVRSNFQLEMPVETVFRTPTLAELALAVEEFLVQDIDAESGSPSGRSESPV